MKPLFPILITMATSRALLLNGARRGKTNEGSRRIYSRNRNYCDYITLRGRKRTK